MIRQCVIYGKEFTLYNSRQKTCSDQCSKKLKQRREAKWRDSHSEDLRAYYREYYQSHKWKVTPTKNCHVCGRPFKQRNVNHWFCSEDCVIEYFSRRVDRLCSLILDARNLKPIDNTRRR